MKNSFVKLIIMAAALAWSFLQTCQAGWLKDYFYFDITGSTVANLYGTNTSGVVVFPNTPSLIERFPAAATGPYEAEIPTAFYDNYGNWLPGYIEPPETGNYTFWVYGDDETQLWITTDGTDPLNATKKQLICSVPGYSNTREWGKFPEQQSAAVYLEKGKQYYLEILHKDGTGGDHLGLGWQPPSGRIERPMQTFYFQPTLDTNDVTIVSGPNAGPISPISPGDPTIYDGMEVMLFADINLTPPYTVQWRRGTTDIPGETQSYYRFRARNSDNGAQFSVRVNGTLYGPLSLTVLSDSVLPSLVSATLAAGNPTQVQLVFSEEVTAATATNAANYTLNNAGTVQAAQLQGDGRTVLLKTSLLMPTNVHTLTINGIQDMALPPNTIAANTQTNFLITDGAISFRVYNTTFATDLATLRTATTNSATPNATYINNLFSEERVITTTTYQWNLVPLRDNFVGQIIGYLTAPETGNYRFGIASDDHSILYLGFTDQRSSKREICNYNGSTGRWNLGAQANQLSGNIALVAGQRYYIEAVHRDGTGGDGVTVGWYTPSMVANGDAFPPATANNQAATTPYLIPATYLSKFSAFGNVFLKTNLPATFSAAESTRPTLRVVADGSTPYAYQWYKGAAPIAGATASTYTLPYVRPADNNATFQVIVTNNFSSVTSVLATLTVTTDSTKPAVASAGSLFKQIIEVRMSEPIAPATATNTANYLLSSSAGTPVAVSSAVQDTNDGAHVTLQTAAMPETDLMKLVVQNLADLSAAANVMNPATNSFRANNFDALERINNSQAYSATAVGDQILMTAGGGDIWDAGDRCAFLYKTVTGNFDYKVQGVSLPAVNQWCKMGPMARASIAAGSRNVFNPFTPTTPGQNTYSAQVRDTTDGNSTSSNDAGTPLNVSVQGGVPARPTILPYPSWTRIQRIGDIFYYYYGSTGTNWTFWTYYDSANTPEGALPATLQLGLALTSHDTARTVDGVMASFTAVNDGTLYLTLQPTNTTVVEGGSANFYAAVAGSTPYSYQWLTNGTPIADGITTNATLTLTRIPYLFNGLQFACRVSNPYGQVVTTSNATLTVTKDQLAPTVRYWLLPKININPTEVKLVFSEWMEPTSAQNMANYQITTSPGGAPLNISGAVLEVDERTVTLTTAPQTPGTTYKVVVNNVRDLACCPPNPVAPNSTDYFFYAGSNPNFRQRADGYVLMEGESYQRLTPGNTVDWTLQNSRPSYSAFGYMLVPTVQANSGGATVSGGVGQGTGSGMEYDILFTLPATNYSVWVRGWNAADGQAAGNNDSIYVGFDGNLIYLGPAGTDANYSYLQSWGAAGWDWRSDRNTGTDPLVLTNVAPGMHRFIIWSREDGTLVDKICLEPGVRSGAGNSAEPSPCTSNGGLGDPETWDFIVAPPAGPMIAISSPTNGQTFPGNATIPITTTITGPTPIVLVEFFQGTNLLGTATATPFAIDWDSVPEGIYSLTARVTDGLGYQATSAAVQVIVDSSKPVAYAVGSLQGTGIGVYFGDVSGLDPVTATNVANYTVNSGTITVTRAALEPDNLAIMLSLSSPVTGQFSVEVKNVADRGFGPNVMNTVTLQSTVVTWPLNQDVGTLSTNPPPLFTDPIMPGLAQAIGTNGFYVRAGGHDIWDAADGMHFVYRPVTGDFDVAVRVVSLLRPNEWSKAGLMVREDLDGTSRNYVIAATPTNGQNQLTVQWRPTKGVASVNVGGVTPAPIPNAWLRMTRTNQAFTFYYATNGINWVIRYTTNLTTTPYPATVYVGLATTSHDNGTNVANLTSAYYYNLTGLKPLPTLRIGVSGNVVTISWTSDDTTLQLQSTDSLLPVNWQPAGGALVVIGNTYSVTIQLTAQPRFFRLVRP